MVDHIRPPLIRSQSPTLTTTVLPGNRAGPWLAPVVSLQVKSSLLSFYCITSLPPLNTLECTPLERETQSSKGCYQLPGRHPPADEHWSLPISLSSWWGSLPPFPAAFIFLPCNESPSRLPQVLPLALLTTALPTVSGTSLSILPVHIFSFPTHTTSTQGRETQWLLQDHQ